MSERLDTKTRILDSAERLFGEKGFDGTSLRDITAEAQVNLAAVNYHFQSKDSLIDAVILRRIEPVNRRRVEMLDAAGSSPSVEQIVEAFLAPLLEKDIPALVPLMGRILTTPDQFLERVFKRHLTGISQRFGEAFAQALPELPLDERVWRIHFMAGVMTHVLLWSRVLPEMTGGICDVSDRKAVVARASQFIGAGFRAPGSLADARTEPAVEAHAEQS
jgi:AcrR family transcriptional regulator